MSIRLRTVHREYVGAHDIIHVDKIPHLLSVFKDQRLLVVQHARSEDRSHSGIWIGECLPGSIDIKEPKCRNRKTVSATVDEANFFLVSLGERINGVNLRRLGFIRRYR